MCAIIFGNGGSSMAKFLKKVFVKNGIDNIDQELETLSMTQRC